MVTLSGDMRRCKIIGTIGPASQNEATLVELVQAGLDIARLNFSHGSHEDHLKTIQLIKRVSEITHKSITILQDLQGPKIRCGTLLGGKVMLEKGGIYQLIYGSTQSEDHIIPIDYKDLVGDIEVGQRVMMDDGLLILEVINIKGRDVEVKVIEGGWLRSRKSVNFPDSILSLPILSEKDTKDLVFGVNHNVDVIALSFVQSAEDVKECKKVIAALGADTPVVAKIEKISAVENIEDICEVADAIMIARGDLGVEGKIEKVPTFQRKIIASSIQRAKPVIIATQMLESMTHYPRASFAERADMAGGVLEGADCLMLSAEVATGKYPVASVATMNATICEVEHWMRQQPTRSASVSGFHDLLGENIAIANDRDAVAFAACEAAYLAKAKAIVCVSLTGSIARAISRWRPKVPIICLSPRKEISQRLHLSWGVYGIQNPIFYNTDTLIQSLPELLKKLGIVQKGDVVVMTAGIPINHLRSTNMVKINTIV
ncbi:MAG: pyruvate kinase [Proteobacteria bacterium]|nr:pyruvate kinase [Pseudomonadota bacterium]